jgi:hypothetical protein
MADRYWVGGGGTWSSTITTNWSETSGGAGGASAPTSLDDVYFDANSDAGSPFTVTISTGAVNRNIKVTSLDQTMTFGGTGTWSVHGDLEFTTGGLLVNSHQGSMNFNGTAGVTNYIKTNGVVLVPGGGASNSPFNIRLNINSGKWVLGSALSITPQSYMGGFYVNGGILDTSGYNLTGVGLQITGSASKEIYLRNSTVTLTSSFYNPSTAGSLLFDAGTSTLNFGVLGSIGTSGQSLNFYNVNFGTTSRGSSSIGGAAVSFNKLTIADSVYNSPVVLSGNITTNELDIKSYCTIISDSLGTQRTLTINSAFTASSNPILFRDVNVAGPLAPISGANFGDAGNNSGITFRPAKTLYSRSSSLFLYTSFTWSDTSNGVANHYLLPQDTGIIDNNSQSNIAWPYSAAYFFGTLNAETRTTPLTLSINISAATQSLYYATFVGDFKLSSSVTLTTPSGSGIGQILSFQGNKNQKIKLSGQQINTISISKVNSSLDLESDLNIVNTRIFDISSGTFNTNNYNLTCGFFSSSNTSIRNINLGTSKITLTGTGVVWNTATATNLVLSAQNSTIALKNSGDQSFAGGGLNYGKLSVENP